MWNLHTRTMQQLSTTTAQALLVVDLECPQAIQDQGQHNLADLPRDPEQRVPQTSTLWTSYRICINLR